MDKWEQVYIRTLERPVFSSLLQICFPISKFEQMFPPLYSAQYTWTKLQGLF